MNSLQRIHEILNDKNFDLTEGWIWSVKDELNNAIEEEKETMDCLKAIYKLAHDLQLKVHESNFAPIREVYNNIMSHASKVIKGI